MMWSRYGNFVFSRANPQAFAPFLVFLPLFILLLVWSIVWKGLALWRAARRGEDYWFVAFLIVNTLGILEILYLYVFSVDENRSSKQQH